MNCVLAEHKTTTKQLMDLHIFKIFFTMEVNEVHQLFGYPYSSKYLLLCSEEE